MRKLVSALVIVLLGSVLCLGCGGDEGTAPAISDLTLQTTSGAVGVQATISGQFTFTDPDGDLESFSVEVTAPNGQSQTLGPQPIQGASGLTTGPVGLAVVLNPPVAGDYALAVWVTDGAGNDSNRLDATFTAQ